MNWDVNGDGGAPDAGTAVVRALDAAIAPNTTVSITYSATYEKSWAAGADIDNTFVAFADPDGNNQPVDPTNPPTSNTTHNEIPQNYAVDASDNGGIADPDGDAATTNDGGDDDATNDDVQLVDEIASGDTVIFTHTVTNQGNGDDIFNLEVSNTDFPPNTVFTFWNADGTVQLTDSDGDGVPDTGVLEQSGAKQSATIVIKADLPAGASGTPANGYNAVLTATSSGNNTVSDPTDLKLTKITAPSVDLAAVGAMQPNKGFNDADILENAHDEGPVLFEPNAAVGSTVIFPMTVANESGSADSFLLSSADLPSGWSVVFKDAGGNTITSTPFLPANGTFEYTAEVTLSNDPAKALADTALSSAARPNDKDGHDITNDSNSVMAATDGDKDYVISFGVTSSVDGGRTDTISHSIDVAPSKAISITPDGQNQIQPGGTVDYPHLLVNNGNVTDPVKLLITNPDSDWSSSILIDTTGDGTPDTELETLAPGDITVVNPDGTTSVITLTGTVGNLVFPLEPGQSIKIINKVFAPADAPQGAVNSITLSATDPNGTVRNTATDTSTVILGQVRLNKTVALDSDCNTIADIDEIPAIAGAQPFAAVQSSKVEPGQCAIWNIDAKNEGDALVKNVIVTDSIPAYTSFVSGSLKYCLGDSCDITADTITDAEADDPGEKSPSTDVVSFYLGTGSIPATKKGGDLQPGQSATIRFTVKVDE